MVGDVLEIFARLKYPTQAQIDGLRRHGVPTKALIFDWSGAPVELRRGYVEFLPGNRFAFENESASGTVHDSLVVIAQDETGDPVDLVAFDFNGSFASWLGVPVLGLETACLPRMSEGLPVFRTPIQWLANYRRGVVIIDPKKARVHLENAGALVVESADHGRHLMAALSFRPQILIQSARAAA